MPGGRSKKKIESEPELVQNLKSVLKIHTAGDPDDEEFLGSPPFLLKVV